MTFSRRRRVDNGEESACEIYPVAETRLGSARAIGTKFDAFSLGRGAALALVEVWWASALFVFPGEVASPQNVLV